MPVKRQFTCSQCGKTGELSATPEVWAAFDRLTELGEGPSVSALFRDWPEEDLNMLIGGLCGSCFSRLFEIDEPPEPGFTEEERGAP